MAAVGIDEPLVVFTGAACAQCTRISKDLLRCSACLHAWYCSQECQRKHFPVHKPSCKVLTRFTALHADLPADLRPKTAQEFFAQRTTACQLLEQITNRPLQRAELRAIINEAKCSVCMKTRDLAELTNCPTCSWGWTCNVCADKYLAGPHQQTCPTYALMNACQLWVQQRVTSTGKVPSYKPDKVLQDYEPVPLQGWDAYTRWRCMPSMNHMMLAVVTKRLSQPLTCLLALQHHYTAQALQEMTSLRILVIGAASYEVPADSVWEEMLHVMPSVKTLVVEFIGPALQAYVDPDQCKKAHLQTVCNQCGEGKRTRTYVYHAATYHEFVRQHQEGGQHETPTLAVAFNTGMSQEAVSGWLPTLEALSASDTPVVFTSYTQQESTGDCKAWEEAGGKVTHPPQQNPYHVLEPFLEPSQMDTFFYQNYWYFCVCSSPSIHFAPDLSYSEFTDVSAACVDGISEPYQNSELVLFVDVHLCMASSGNHSGMANSKKTLILFIQKLDESQLSN